MGRRLRDRRVELGLTQQDVAFKSGVSVMTVSKLERGLHRASPLARKALADALGTTVEELFINGHGSPQPASPRHPSEGLSTQEDG